MNAARGLRWARRRSGLSQRELAARSGVPQSTIGRIEAGLVDPRVRTLSRLLRACGFDLEVEPRLGEGVDRTLFRELLALTPEQRLTRARQGARVLAAIGAARKERAAGG
jgi:predicted transcriptional regulator